MKRLQLLVLFLGVALGHSQTFTAKLIDKADQSPIPFAAIQTQENEGVISNEEGVFQLNLEEGKIESIQISCLGYQLVTLSLSEIENRNFIIELEEAVNELSTVFLNNTKTDVDSIIARVIANLEKNYRSEMVQHKFFYRETNYLDFENLNLDIRKATDVKKLELSEANAELDQLSHDIMTSNLMHFTDFMGELSIKDSKNIKLNVDKATQIINTRKNFSLDNIQETAQRIVLKYLDTTKTYKLKTSFIKVEDSLSLQSDNSDKSKDHNFENENLKRDANNLLKYAQPNNTEFIKGILDKERYEYTLRDVNYFNEHLVYIIDYAPIKRKSKYTGTLFVTDDSFAILKLDFMYSKGKRGDKFNLKLILGVKYIENVSQGTIIFKKSENDWYTPRYVKLESGEYFYVRRPLKFIENSAVKNKVAFNFKIEGDTKHKEELLFVNSQTLSDATYSSLTEVKKIPYQIQKRYDAKVWGANEVLVPSEELKAFDASNNR